MRPFSKLSRIIIMTQNLEKIFKKLKNLEPSTGLEAKILKAIILENSRKVSRKLMFSRAGLVASFGALVYTLFIFGKAFLESDFWNLAKLAFSDSGVIVSHASEYSISLLETLPVVEIFAMLIPVLAVMIMLSYYFKFTNNNHFNPYKL
jgi:hypothetical protein